MSAFDLNTFFKQYSVSEISQKYFDGFKILKVSFNKQEDVVIVLIKLNNPLPYSSYANLKEYLANSLDKKVRILVETEGNDISVVDIQGYLDDFSSLHSMFKKTTPQLEGNILKLLKDEELVIDEEYVDELTMYLIQLGIKLAITLENKKVEEIKPETVSVNMKEYESKVAAKTNSFEKSYENKSYSNNNGNGNVAKTSFTPKRKRNFDDYPLVTINDLAEGSFQVAFVGEVFKTDEMTTKSGYVIQTIMIKDLDNATSAKRFMKEAEFKADENPLKKGKCYKFYGSYKYDEYAKTNIFNLDGYEQTGPLSVLVDDEEEKRVELHVHSNRSEMDGVCDVSELVTAAFNMGHRGMAITDHAVVQGFPIAQRTVKGLLKANPDREFKMLYGVEFNMVDERLKICYNPTDDQLRDQEYVVFDLETTGLSQYYDSIIEFGAVLYSHGQIIERKDFFVKPPHPIPVFIQEKTHISESDVADARTFKECVAEIDEFIKGRVLVAHNAAFDYGFLNEERRRIGLPPYMNPVIDTLDLARSLFKNRRAYRLGNMARQYKIEYDEEVAHRADYDAEVLLQVFNRMLQDCYALDIKTIQELADYQTEDAFVKNRASHVNALCLNKAGLKDLFKLVTISHTTQLAVLSKSATKTDGAETPAEPRIFRSTLNEYRKDLLIGTGCLNGEVFDKAAYRNQKELEDAIKFYDYIEVQPLENYRMLVEDNKIQDLDRLKDIVKRIIYTAMDLGKIVVATGDVHYVKKEEKILREVYINSQGIGGARHPLYLYDRTKRERIKTTDQRFLNTREMLDAFAYLADEELIRDIVINNPNKILDMCDSLKPIHDKLFTPTIDNSDQLLTDLVYKRAHEIYGDPLDPIVEARIKKELDSIIGNGYGVIYYVSHLLVKRSNDDGYLVGSRGSVGSSFVATMAGITEVNALAPHYVCPHCKHIEWVEDAASGFNMPDKVCPECGTMMKCDGQNIPFETFLGFEGDKVPDIDLNFGSEYQAKAHLFTREVFGEDHVFRAGTISTVAEKTAFGYVKGYAEERPNLELSPAMVERLAAGCTDVKRTTGQHPGGIIVIPREFDVYDFTPVQYPANDPNSVWKTTHFDFHEIHDNVLKFDILGHVDPSAMRLLQNISGIDPKTIPMNDERVMSIFNSSKELNIINPLYNEVTGACGLPEFGTKFVRGILELTKPKTFSELVQISGLSHGTDVWANNAENLVRDGLPLSSVIGCRDDIMSDLLKYNLPSKQAFNIMEHVRKGKGLTEEEENLMIEHDVPKWYINSCKLIKYMFPKAHAVAYVMMAVRIAWFKVYHPIYYYISYFSLRCDAYELETMTKDAAVIKARMDDIQSRKGSKDPMMKVTKKEEDIYDTLEVVYEMVSRGFKISNVDINLSKASEFIVNPNNPKEIVPPFIVLDGLGENVGQSIVEARLQKPFISKEDLMRRTQLSKTLKDKLEKLGCLSHLDDSNQVSLF